VLPNLSSSWHRTDVVHCTLCFIVHQKQTFARNRTIRGLTTFCCRSILGLQFVLHLERLSYPNFLSLSPYHELNNSRTGCLRILVYPRIAISPTKHSSGFVVGDFVIIVIILLQMKELCASSYIINNNTIIGYYCLLKLGCIFDIMQNFYNIVTQ